MTSRHDMIQRALAAMHQAYAPYSHFAVGAALLARPLPPASSAPRLFEGCNVENISFGLTLCAERGAISAAIADGHRDFTEIAVASRGGVTPCGACRQVMAEFQPNLLIVLVDAEVTPPGIRLVSAADLLPDRFRCDV